MTTWTRNTTGLLEAVRARSVDARSRAERAIDELERESAAVTFNAVARRAGVTKAYLYAQPRLRERIVELRARPVRRH